MYNMAISQKKIFLITFFGMLLLIGLYLSTKNATAAVENEDLMIDISVSDGPESDQIIVSGTITIKNALTFEYIEISVSVAGIEIISYRIFEGQYAPVGSQTFETIEEIPEEFEPVLDAAPGTYDVHIEYKYTLEGEVTPKSIVEDESIHIGSDDVLENLGSATGAATIAMSAGSAAVAATSISSIGPMFFGDFFKDLKAIMKAFTTGKQSKKLMKKFPLSAKTYGGVQLGSFLQHILGGAIETDGGEEIEESKEDTEKEEKVPIKEEEEKISKKQKKKEEKRKKKEEMEKEIQRKKQEKIAEKEKKKESKKRKKEKIEEIKEDTEKEEEVPIKDDEEKISKKDKKKEEKRKKKEEIEKEILRKKQEKIAEKEKKKESKKRKKEDVKEEEAEVVEKIPLSNPEIETYLKELIKEAWTQKYCPVCNSKWNTKKEQCNRKKCGADFETAQKHWVDTRFPVVIELAQLINAKNIKLKKARKKLKLKKKKIPKKEISIYAGILFQSQLMKIKWKSIVPTGKLLRSGLIITVTLFLWLFLSGYSSLSLGNLFITLGTGILVPVLIMLGLRYRIGKITKEREQENDSKEES